MSTVAAPPPAPSQEIIAKLKKHKILIGIALVGMTLIFVGGVVSNDEPANATKSAHNQQASAPQAQPQPAQQTPDEFGPTLATQFVSWWMQKAMDYSIGNAKPSHVEALQWMTPPAAVGFRNQFWTQEIENEVLSGRVMAAYQPMSVQAEAINPDGSIVVGVTGTLVMQVAGAAPATSQIAVDFLVTKQPQGLQIAGLYNHSVITSTGGAQ